MNEIYTTRFGFFEKVGQVSGEIDSVHASVYRLVTWIGSYDEAKVVRMSSEMAGQVDAAVAVFQGLAADPRLSDDEKRILQAVVGHLGEYKKHVASALDLATVDVNTGLAALQTADGTFQELRTDLDALIEIRAHARPEELRRGDAGGSALEARRRAGVPARRSGRIAGGGDGSRAPSPARLGGEPEYAAAVARLVAEGDLTVNDHDAGQPDLERPLRHEGDGGASGAGRGRGPRLRRRARRGVRPGQRDRTDPCRRGPRSRRPRWRRRPRPSSR